MHTGAGHASLRSCPAGSAALNGQTIKYHQIMSHMVPGVKSTHLSADRYSIGTLDRRCERGEERTERSDENGGEGQHTDC
jgi:hypothetical protein